MALSAMFILEVTVVFSFIITSLFMFIPKNNKTVHNIFFALSVMLGVLVSVIDATSLPSNFKPQIILAWLGLIPAAAGVIISVSRGKATTLTKLFAMVTVLYGILGYYFLA